MGVGQLLGMGSFQPYNFKSLKVTEGHRPIGFRFSNNIINIQANLNGKDILACGEDQNKEIATAKAFSELFERAALYTDKAAQLGIQTSNGFASHPNRASAELNALLEVVERDAVLSNWYLKRPFKQIENATLPANLVNWTNDELSRSEFPILKLLLSTEGLGPAVTCILMNENGHGVTGHASGTSLLSAINSSIAEACRSAHHALRMTYWDESRRLKEINSIVQPSAHSVFYAHHSKLPDWIFGEEISYEICIEAWKRMAELIVSNRTDFDFQVFLTSPVYTVLATHPQSIEIEWGSKINNSFSKPVVNMRFSAQLKDGSINLEPHFVA